MKNYTIVKISNAWSTKKMQLKVEETLNSKTKDGYEIVSVSFGFNNWLVPTAYITVCR